MYSIVFSAYPLSGYIILASQYIRHHLIFCTYNTPSTLLHFNFNHETKKSPQSMNFKGGACFLFNYIRTAVPLTATINIPSRTTS